MSVLAEGEQPEGIPYFTETPESQNNPDVTTTDTLIDKKNTWLVVSDHPIIPPTSSKAYTTSSFKDPWFTCILDDVDGVDDGFCRYLEVQAAIDDFMIRGGYGIIMLEPGSFIENITVNNILQLTGIAGEDILLPTQITGNLTILSQNDFVLRNLIITGGVLISDSTGSLEINNVAVTNAPENGIEIQNHAGNISIESISLNENNGTGLHIQSNSGYVSIRNCTSNDNNSGIRINAREGVWVDACVINANQSMGVEIMTAGPVLVANSHISNNLGTGMVGLGIITNGPVTLNSVIANGNTGDGAILLSMGNDISVNNSTFNHNGLYGFRAFWLEYSILRVNGVHACYNKSGGLYPYGSVKLGSIDVCKIESEQFAFSTLTSTDTIRTIFLNTISPTAQFSLDKTTHVIFEDPESLTGVETGVVIFPATYPAETTIRVNLITQDDMETSPAPSGQWMEPGLEISATNTAGEALSEISSFSVCFVNHDRYSEPILAFLAPGSDSWTVLDTWINNQQVCTTSNQTGQFILTDGAP